MYHMFGNVREVSVELLPESGPSFVMNGVKTVPDQLNVLVFLQFGGDNALGDPMSFEGFVKEVKNDGGDAFLLVFGSDANEVEYAFLAVFASP